MMQVLMCCSTVCVESGMYNMHILIDQNYICSTDLYYNLKNFHHGNQGDVGFSGKCSNNDLSGFHKCEHNGFISCLPHKLVMTFLFCNYKCHFFPSQNV